MPVTTCNSIEIAYERHGNLSDPAIVLIAGLGFQLIDWPVTMCETLVAGGYQVIRFDNRDIGLSQKMSMVSFPYQLEDMAKDVSDLIKELSLQKAHIVGMSMGGMIAQLMAILHPEQVLSLTSIMSTSSDPLLPGPSAETASILAMAPQTTHKEAIVAFGLKVNEVIGSPGFRWPTNALKAHIEACIDRSYSPAGYMRQYAAVLSSQSRRKKLTTIKAPSLVIHGQDDPLVPLACGQDVADHIEGSRFISVAGMGHDLSPSLCDHLAKLILAHVNGVKN